LEGRLWPVQDVGYEGSLGESPEGQSGPGRLDFLQGGSLKDTGAGCPHVPQDKLAGKMTGLAEQGALAGTQEKRRLYHLWKKGQATQEEYRGLIRTCREEIRKAKAQLELRLATVVRDNKKCFYKYINNQKRAKENLHPLLDAGGNIANKDEENGLVLSAFFASIFNRQIGYFQGSQAPVLEDREGEQNKPPIIQEEAVNDLLCHLDTYRSMGPDGIYPRVLRELAEKLAKPLSIIYQQSWLTGKVPDDWRIASVTPIYQKARRRIQGTTGLSA